MRNQEIFDKVATHLLTQFARSESEFGCAYRGDKGRKCAIGCLIPDDLYNQVMEGAAVETFFEPNCLDYRADYEAFIPVRKRLGLSSRSVELLSELQSIHDACKIQYWEDELKSLAKRKRLIMPKITRVESSKEIREKRGVSV